MNLKLFAVEDGPSHGKRKGLSEVFWWTFFVRSIDCGDIPLTASIKSYQSYSLASTSIDFVAKKELLLNWLGS